MAQSKQIMWVDQVNKGYDQMKSIYEGSNADYKAKQKAMIEYGFAKNAFRNNATLQKCDPISILESVVNIARTSLSLNPALRLAYLIPRKGKCTLEISYMGMIKLLRDSGAIQHIEAFIVFEDEEFEYNITENEMYKKTVIKRHSKTLIAEPTPAIMAALDIENYNNGLKNLKKSSIYDAIDEGIEKNNAITENNAESMLLFEEE
jgi:phage RecT family recombinase